MKKVVILFICLLTMLLTACGKTNIKETSISLFAMDTFMTLKAYGDNAEEALNKAENEINAIENLLSTGKEDSEISVLNKNGSANVSDLTYYLLKKSVDINTMTYGAFNPLIYPLMKLWGFTDKQYYKPSDNEIADLLPLINIDNMELMDLNNHVIFKMDGVMADLGGIAKGYTSSKVMEIFQENGVTSGIVSLGGNVQALGLKPDGSKWVVAIKDPVDPREYLGYVFIDNEAVITSGGYERFFEENGETYHHILDPANGKPANSGLISVSIISADGTLADGLSTALYVLGLEKASQVWKENSDLFDAVFVTDDGSLYITENISKDFKSDKKFNIIKK